MLGRGDPRRLGSEGGALCPFVAESGGDRDGVSEILPLDPGIAGGLWLVLVAVSSFLPPPHLLRW